MANDYDTMSVTSLDVVPGVPVVNSSSLIANGSGRDRPIVLVFDERRTFEVAFRMLAACDQINRVQFVATLRQLSERVLGGAPRAADLAPSPEVRPDPPAGGATSVAPAPPVPSVPALSPAGTASSASEPSGPSADFDWLIDHAATFQAECRRRGLSDAVIAQLVPLSMGENVLMSLAEGAISRSMSARTSAVGASPPWQVEIGPDLFDVDVDVAQGVILLIPGSGRAGQPDRCPGEMSAVEAHLLGSALQAASSHVQRARLQAPTDHRDADPVTPVTQGPGRAR